MLGSIARLFVSGGYPMYPILIVAVAVLVLSARAGWRIARADDLRDSGPGGPSDGTLDTTIDAVLFWGAFAVVIGILGTLIGVVRTAGAIARIGEVGTALVWHAIRVSLIPTIGALLLFGVAALAWYFLRSAYSRRVALGGPGPA